jgi:hypothetical protein
MLLGFRPFLRVLVGLWLCYTALAQPGLPACWLQAKACQIHPHFTGEHAGGPHTHDYLFDLTKTIASSGLAVVLIPISLLIGIMLANLLHFITAYPPLIKRSWIALLEPPPPRLAISSATAPRLISAAFLWSFRPQPGTFYGLISGGNS